MPKLPLLVILELKNIDIFENLKSCQLDEIGDLNFHRPTVSEIPARESSYQNKDSTVSEITFISTLPAHQEPEMESIQEFRCSPWEAGLLWQPYPEPGAFVIPFADQLPVLISVAENPSQLILKHLSITGTD